MKINKKIAAVALVAAMSVTSLSAFAATYDEYMVKAEELYSQGMYYEANTALEKAYNISGATAQYQALKPAIELRIRGLQLPVAKALPAAFADVQTLIGKGLYYEASFLLEEIDAAYSKEIAESAEFTSKYFLLRDKVNELIACWEYDVAANAVWQKYYNRDFKGAYAELAKIATYPASRAAAYDKLYNYVVWKYNNLVTSAEEAVAAVKEVVAKDADFGFEPKAVLDAKGNLEYYTVTVYSKNAYKKGWASTLSVYKVYKNGATEIL